MGRLMERIQSAQISRREFLKGAAAATSAVMLAGCSDADSTLVESTTQETPAPIIDVEPNANPTINAVDKAILEGKGEWRTAACWHNCGGRCLNKVYVADGVVLRAKTDDAHEDSWDYPQNRGCIRGRSQRKHVLGADRLKYPMKRKNWSPENPNGHLRGVDEWERISWDEAITYIADQLKKAAATYGNRSIAYFTILNSEGGYMGPLLSAMGGYTTACGTDSYGTFNFAPQMYGFMSSEASDRYDLFQADTIVMYGINAPWAVHGSSLYLQEAHKRGVKFAFVGPEYNVGAAAFDADWYPVRTGTDTAFLLGVAFAMLEMDAEHQLIHWDFLNKYTVGFDAEHMPEDAKTNENFKDYVLGKYDGIPKTPAWASEICGTPEDRIRDYAKLMGKNNKVHIHCSGSPARNRAAENFPQLLMTLACMGGHFGEAGHACAHDECYSVFNRGPALVSGGWAGLPFVWTHANNPVDDIVPSGELWSAVLDGVYHYGGDTFSQNVRPGETREIDIRVLVNEHVNYLQTREGQAKGIEAFRKVDFVVTNATWLHTSAKYSDIVLPVATRWERNAGIPYNGNADRETLFVYQPILEPIYETKSDYEIAKLLSEKLGLDFESFVPYDEKQQFFNQMQGSVVMNKEGAYEPLVTITEDDIKEWGCVGQPQQGKITLNQLLEQGYYRVERSEGDAYYYISYKGFRDDPAANPLPTKSGKFEIYCQTKSDWFDMFNSTWPTYRPVSPLPKYLETTEGYTTSFKNWETKEKGEYPYLVSNPHYLRRAHTSLDGVTWLREAMTNPVFISKADADEKGIVSGDTVILWNDNGKVLRQAQVTRRLMPGNILLPHGAAVEIDEKTGIDLAGSDNMLVSPNKSTALGNNGYNSTLVNFEKYDGEALQPDCTWKQRVIF